MTKPLRRWRAALAGGVLALGSGVCALAATENLDALLAGATLTVTNQQGILSIHLAADRRYDYAEPNGARHEGVWRTTAQELCLLTTNPPADPPQEHCLMIPVDRLGARWTAEDSLNGHIVYALAKKRR